MLSKPKVAAKGTFAAASYDDTRSVQRSSKETRGDMSMVEERIRMRASQLFQIVFSFRNAQAAVTRHCLWRWGGGGGEVEGGRASRNEKSHSVGASVRVVRSRQNVKKMFFFVL